MNLNDYCIKEGKEYLLTEWDAEKNRQISPENVSHSSSVPVWWRCQKGHSWQTQLKSRSATLTRCPKCNAEAMAKKRKMQAKRTSGGGGRASFGGGGGFSGGGRGGGSR